jgi:ribosomal protein L37E
MSEKCEVKKDKVVCRKCGNDAFRVYITVIIDDARLYCSKCGGMV